MKKVALSLIALLAAGTFAFAEDVAVEKNAAVSAKLSADASASFGFDLDTKVHGFSNGANFDLDLIIVPEATSSKTGEGDVHGYISIEKVSIEIDDQDGTADDDSTILSIGDITAKIVAGDFYVKLYTNSDAKAGYTLDGDDDSIYVLGEPKKYSTKYGAADAEWTLGDTTGYGFFDGTGVEVGYTVPSVASFAAVVASSGDWSAADDNAYEGSLAASLLAVEKLTLTGKFVLSRFADAEKTAIGGELAYDFGVAVPFAHANYDLSGNLWDSDLGARLPLVDGLNAVLAVQYDSDSVANIVVTADLAEAKLAGPLSAIVGFRTFDLSKKVDTDGYGEVFVKVGLKATDVIKVTGTVNAYGESLFAKAGVDFTGISLTTISVNWDSSDLGASKTTGDSKLGKLVLTGKVAY